MSGRGHGPKIAEAVAALESDGALPPRLRPGVRNKLIWDRLRMLGYRCDLPSASAIRRFFTSRICNAVEMAQMVETA